MDALEEAYEIGYGAGLTPHELRMAVIDSREDRGEEIKNPVPEATADAWLVAAYEQSPEELKRTAEAYSKYLFQVFSF